MRQLVRAEIVPPIELIGVLGAEARDLIEARGIEFVDRGAEFDGPGPTQWAAVALEDGSQFIVEHHYAHPERFLEVAGQMGQSTPRELCQRFALALEIEDGEFSWIAEDWPRPRDR